MKSTITIRGPVTVTYLRNGGIRIEAEHHRARMHVRTDEFMHLINAAAAGSPAPVAQLSADERFGAF